MLGNGVKGEMVLNLQVGLNLALAGHPNAVPLTLDGSYGPRTMAAAKLLGTIIGILPDDKNTYYEMYMQALDLYNKGRKRFVVIVDAGHGGIHPDTKEYMTAPINGKKWRHKGAKLHLGSEWFYEGYENRMAADGLMWKMRDMGILAQPAHHPYLDLWGTTSNSQELARRANVGRPYLERGFRVLYYSLHSNAVSDEVKDKNDKFVRYKTESEMDATRGGIVYTSEGLTESDKASSFLLGKWQERFGDEWTWFKDENRKVNKLEMPTQYSDYEQDFAVLFHSETMGGRVAAELKDGSLRKVVVNGKERYYSANLMAVLAERDFFTSRKGAEWLIKPETRAAFLQCDVEFVQYAMNLFNYNL